VTLRIGILGAARVATYAMIDAARDVEGVTVHAVAARDPLRAQAYADVHHIPHVYPSYQALIEADDIDAVYTALPPNLHAPWSIAAVEAGKPVLCEKPFALSIADVEAMLAAEARTGTLIMEAQHTQYHPINVRARAVLAAQDIGTVRHIHGCFTTAIPYDPNEMRWDGAVGGGALWDLGVYPAYWLRSFMGAEPGVTAARHQLCDTGADTLTSARLAFPSGATGEISCDMISATEAWVKVEGSTGEMIVHNPLSSAMPQSLTLIRDGVTTTERFTRRASFAFQLEAFREAVVHGAPVPTRGLDSLATICLLSATRDTAMGYS
jgi:predicted dehydrogenase